MSFQYNAPGPFESHAQCHCVGPQPGQLLCPCKQREQQLNFKPFMPQGRPTQELVRRLSAKEEMDLAIQLFMADKAPSLKDAVAMVRAAAAS